MKIPLNWLAEYVDIKGLSPEKISDGLRLSGTENVLEKGLSFPNVVVGEIKEIIKHPNADKLQVAKVDVGNALPVISPARAGLRPGSEVEKATEKEDRSLRSSNDSVEMTKSGNDSKSLTAHLPKGLSDSGTEGSPFPTYLTIVCGAPNIKVGQKVPVALVGAKFGDFEIKKAKIRDVESSGMLCAEDELGLGEDHSGIMILDKAAKVGQLLSDYLVGSRTSNNVIDAELTPNRGDCLSMIGMAREVGATFDRKFKMPVVKKAEIKSNKTIDVEVDDKNLCPRYIAKVVEDIKIGPSPKWMQERLMSAGVRSISNIVDVTNYVMLELGQPLHAFDFSKLSGMQASNSKHQIPNNKNSKNKKLIIRRAKKGEKIITLDSVSRSLTTDDLLICDGEKPVALAGVMGGLNSEVDENTTTIVLEAAVFDPTSIRKTAQSLNLRSEASNRFEKGIPLTLPEIAIERAVELLVSTSGNTKVGPNTDVLSSWVWVQRIGLRLSRIKELLGVDVKETEVKKILGSLEIEAEKFDFKAEARKHVGKPYVFGARYKTHGEMAFDCSYLTDFIYSKIGQFIGYTSLAQYELGYSVNSDELLPGDILFVKGHIDKSATDHYFVPNIKGGLVQRSLGGVGYEKVTLEKPIEVGHNALYIGNGRVVHARHYDFDSKTKKWKKLSEGKVVEENAEVFTKNPEYLGARRYIKDPTDYYAITVPWWRLDLKIEEDILEEIARIYGYNNIPSTLPSGPLPGLAQNKRVEMEAKLKQKLICQGLTEVISYSFVSEKLAKLSEIELSGLPKISNPLSVDQEYMRGVLWPSLVEVVAKNQDYGDKTSLFEVANVYQKDKQSENLHLSVAIRLDSPQKSFFDLKGLVISILSDFYTGEIGFRSAENTFSEKGQSAEVLLNKKVIGQIGVVSKKISQAVGIKIGGLAIVELDLSSIQGHYGRTIVYKSLPKYPRSKRDINIVIDSNVTVSEVEKHLATINNQYLLGYRVADVYEGKLASSKQNKNEDSAQISQSGLPDTKKSITIKLEIGSDNKTLTDEEINSSVDVVIELFSKIGGELRS